MSARAYRWPRALLCAAVTLALHVWLLQAAGFGTDGPRKARLPERQGPGATAIASSAEPSMTVVFIEDSDTLLEDSDPQEPASSGTAPMMSVVTVLSPNPLPTIEISNLVDDKKADAAVEAGDPVARAKLFGVYAGQINARIERAWRRPRSPVAEVAATSNDEDRDFRCKARVYQDNHGAVQEIELVKCNGTQKWQQSLLEAIQTASPLPAPPTPEVFSNSITLAFTGTAYEPGMSDDGYETAHAVTRVAGVPSAKGSTGAVNGEPAIRMDLPPDSPQRE